ncbi:FHA domain-containing protein [Aggregatilinea lenta]|uniref:FHA domain-containing protein n=1 Tax=Aggregatilinea lenta TaxID=913108 RepID=UPI0013C3289A|nr:FHA domain-containing protein [Aggregatilinea lenta]
MPNGADKPVLIIHEGEKAGTRWTVRDDQIVIGRGGECDLVLPERQVSREHIRIYRGTDNSYYLEDLDSKNGTWVNGKQVKATTVPLRDGDEVQIALAVKITFVGSEATAPLMVDELPGVLGRLQLNRDSRRVFIDRVEVDPPLSLPQYRLLELLYDGAGAVRTRDEVIEAVWPDAVGEGVSEQAIDALVRRLRDRLAEVDPAHQYIVTVRGHGFRLEQG